MANRRLTERRIERLRYTPNGPSRQIEFDTDLLGFGVRLYPSGVRSYVLQYGTETKRKLMVLGRVGALTIDQARTLARENLHLLAREVDPLTNRGLKRRERAEAITVKALAKDYLDQNEDRWSRSHAAESRRRLEGHVIETLGQIAARDVTRTDINKLHSKITKSGAPVEANRVRTILHSMFEWASEFGHLPEDHLNPAKRRKGSPIGRNAEGSRARYLTLEEAPKLLQAADSLGQGVIVRLWLLTGLRRSELLHRRWSDVDWKRKELTVPETKNGRTHVVPLSDRAIELLNSLPRPIDPHAPIFPGRQQDEPLADLKKPWQEIRRVSGLHDLTIHDLRRTVGTWLTNLAGVPITTVSALLNHKPTSGPRL